jgi:hypothetical protein
MSTALTMHRNEDTGVTLWRKPDTVIAEAKEAATALIAVISQKKDKVIFNGEQYIEREDWGLVARFWNCTPKIIETRYVNYGGVVGFEAIAVCIDGNQNEIGRAESMCLSDEDNWGDVPIYKWEDELDSNGKKIWVPPANGKKGYYKARKVEIGRKPKPLFQLRSMAETRAEAKVLKSIFGFVVVLAGFKPTPAEEMTGYGQPTEPDPQGPGPQSAEAKISPEQVNQLSAVLKESGYIGADGRAEVRAWFKAQYGFETSPEIKVSQFPAVMEWAKKPRPKTESKDAAKAESATEAKTSPGLYDSYFDVLDWKPDERADYMARMSKFSDGQIKADLNRLIDEMNAKQ